jgi:MoxR-like ATPases
MRRRANVSRHHAELTIRDGEAFIKDLNSTVGVMVNSKVVQSAELASGDIIQLGMMKFIIELPPKEKRSDAKSIVLNNALAEEAADHLENDLRHLSRRCAEIRSEVGKIIVGQTDTVEGILVALLCQGHCLLIGVPGLAKTVMVCTFAKILGLDTQRIQFTPDLMPSDIIGSEILKKNKDGLPELQFNQGPIFTQLLLADEINRTPPKTQSALLEAMQERQVTVAMKSFQLPLPFCVIATQNPIEQEGTYPLPEAQQDRFMLCLYLDYPDFGEELEIMTRTTSKQKAECCSIIEQNEIIRFQQIVQSIAVPGEQIELAVNIIRATRPDSPEAKAAGVSEFIDWGAGPRAGQALIKGAKAIAAMDGRPAVAPEDILHLVVPVLRHRISCNYKARSEGVTESEIIRRIVQNMKIR